MASVIERGKLAGDVEGKGAVLKKSVSRCEIGKFQTYSF